jgi:hypothetical protein
MNRSYNNIEVVARFEKENNEYMYLYDLSMEYVYCLCTSDMKQSFKGETIDYIVCDLLEATNIYYINKDYIKAIKNELHEMDFTTDEKIKAFDLLQTCYEWE